MERWEYYTTMLGPASSDQRAIADRINYLNAMGNDGWELISVVQARTQAHAQGSEHEGFFGGEYQNQEISTSTTVYEAFFKRRRAGY